MLRRNFIKLAGAAAAMLATSAVAETHPTEITGEGAPAMPTPKSGYATVNGLRMYYEIRGTGAPLVMLHGGVTGIETFAANLDALAVGRQVIAVDLQAHGRTADIDRPLRFETMADDIAALITALGLSRVDLLGYSMGGGVAQQVAIRHPEVVRKLILVSAAFKRNGSYPEVIAVFDAMGPQFGDMMKQSPLAALYPTVDWSNLFGKLGDLMRQDYDWSAEVARIKAPTLLVFADADSIRLDHMMDAYRLRGGGQRDGGVDGSGRAAAQFSIIPGTIHYDIAASPKLVATITPFLDARAAATD